MKYEALYTLILFHSADCLAVLQAVAHVPRTMNMHKVIFLLFDF